MNSSPLELRYWSENNSPLHNIDHNSENKSPNDQTRSLDIYQANEVF